MRLQRRAGWVLGLAFLAFACNREAESPAENLPIVARVGDREVTLSYYEERLEKMDRKYLPDTLDLAGRREFLDFIINKELMALKAEELGYSEEPGVQEGMATLEENLIITEAIEQAVAGKTDASEEEIQQFYEYKQNDIMAKHVVVATKEEAQDVYEQLVAGADFDSLVEARSLVPTVDQTGRDLPLQQRAVFGWLQYGQAQPVVEAAVFGTPLNQPAEPVQTPYGWHVFMPVSMKARKQTPFEEQRELIARQISLRKRRQLTNDYYESILAEHDFVMHRDALTTAFSKLPPDTPEPPDPRNEIKPVIDYTHEDLRTVLYELDGNKVTIADFSDLYDNTPWVERPRSSYGTQGLYYWIRDRWLQPLQLERARRDGVDKLPKIVNEMKLRHEQLMVAALHGNLIAHQVPEPTEEELRKFYEDNAATYVDKEKRICNLIFHPRKRVVDRAYRELQGGGDFVQIAIRYNDIATEKAHIQTAAFSRDDEKHAELVPVAFSLDLHEYGEPFKSTTEGSVGWVVVQVDQIIPEKPFAFEDIEEFVQRDWRNNWSEKRLNELLDEWRQDYAIEIYDEVLQGAEVRRDDVFVPASESASTPEGAAGGDE